MPPDLSDEKRQKLPLLKDLLLQGREAHATHMLRLQNITTQDEVTVYVQTGTSPQQAFVDYIAAHGPIFDPIECYDLSIDLNAQLQCHRAYNWNKDLPVFTGPFSAVYPAE